MIPRPPVLFDDRRDKVYRNRGVGQTPSAHTCKAVFYALSSMTLHVVALCIDVSLLRSSFNVDIRSGGDVVL